MFLCGTAFLMFWVFSGPFWVGQFVSFDDSVFGLNFDCLGLNFVFGWMIWWTW